MRRYYDLSKNNIDYNKITLLQKKIREEHFGPGVSQVIKTFDVMYDNKRIGTVETYASSLGLNYISNLKVLSQFRNLGIGSYLLKKFFRGYYISAGNPRVTALYERLGKNQSKFSAKENKLLAQHMGMWGTWKIK